MFFYILLKYTLYFLGKSTKSGVDLTKKLNYTNAYHCIHLSLNNKMATTCISSVGSINDSGILHGLLRKGFTPIKSLSELLANSIDADATHVLYKVTSSHIKLIDDGNAMTQDDIRNMFDMHKENHAGEKTIGVSGVGGKASTMVLSEQTTVIMYTKTSIGIGYVVTIPWDIMFREGKYTGMITVNTMTENELSEFHKERENMKNKNSGVTICFTYNDALKVEIEKQFVSPFNNEIDIENQLSFIYGRFNVDVRYEHFEESLPKIMKKYDYFGGENNAYYKGKSDETIKLYESKKNVYRYIWDDKTNQYEIKRHAKGFKKELEIITESLNGWKHIGDYHVNTGCRRDKNYFNEESVELPQSADDICLEYDKEYFGESKNERLCKPHLIRNGQFICSFDLPDVTISKRRVNAKSMFQIRHVKCCLVYNPISNLDNKQDLLCGIQENKNQCACLLEIPFSRLIQGIKKIKSDEIWNYFEVTVKLHKEKQEALALSLKQTESVVVVQEETETVVVVQEEVSEEEPVVVVQEEVSEEPVVVVQEEESEEPAVVVQEEESEEEESEEEVQTKPTVIQEEEESSEEEELVDMPVVVVAAIPQQLTKFQLLLEEENKQLKYRIKQLEEENIMLKSKKRN